MAGENGYIINPIDPQETGIKAPSKAPGLSSHGTVGDVSFKQYVKEYLNDVNNMQLNSEDSIAKLATGEIKDVHQVMTAVAEAELSFKMMMEIRNKLVSAYQELIKTPV